MKRLLLMGLVFFIGCKSNQAPGPAVAGDFREVGVKFARALAAHDYPAALALTTKEYQAKTTITLLAKQYETMIPTDWGPVNNIQAGETLKVWPDKRPNDVGWAYISIEGDGSSEAVVVVVAIEDGALKIRSVEFGRP